MRKSVQIALIFLLLFCSGFSISWIKNEYGDSYPVLGADALENIEIAEDHKAALGHWLEKGIRDSVLLNIDAHDDMKRIPSGKMEKIRRSCEEKKPTNGSGSDAFTLATNAEFIYAAAKLGIVSKVIWMVPSSYDLFSDSGGRLAELLKMYGFADEDITTFRMQDGRFVGRVDSIPVVICDAGCLPAVNEPILLSIDVDFFPELVKTHNLLITEGLKETISALFNKRYKVKDAVVAYSVSGGYLNTCYRWVGDLVIEILRRPGILSRAELPDRYTFMQRADMLLMMKRYEEVAEYLSQFLSKQGLDPAIPMYAACAWQGLGDFEKSFVCAEKACMADKDYCYGLPEMGVAALQAKGLDAAEKFFLRGYEMNPGMDYAQFTLAMAMKKSGRYDEAIRYLTIFRSHNGPFPADLYLGDTYLQKKDEKSACDHYESGRNEIRDNPSVLSGLGDFKAIERAAQFFEKKGRGRDAAELRELVGR